jgi:ribonuclease R
VIEIVAEHPGISTEELRRRWLRARAERGLPELASRETAVEDLFPGELHHEAAGGGVLEIPGSGWFLPDATPLRVGRFRVDRRGNGIVTMLVPGEPALFIDADGRVDSVSGDTVLVQRIARAKGRLLARAVVVRVIERGSRLVRGLFRREGTGGYVFADDWTLVERLWVPQVPADVARDGDRVLVRPIIGSRQGWPLAEIAVQLRDEGSLESDLEIIRAEFGLPEPQHAPEVITAAEALPGLVERSEWPDRRDLRDLVTLTIDPVDAKDFDDAVSIEKMPSGAWRLGVHVADVAHWVEPRSVLDDAAADRGTSVYLPGQVIPMLPERLSNDLCSLRPDVDRLTVTVFLYFGFHPLEAEAASESGEPSDGPRRVEIVRSVIRSRRRFSYEEVQAILDSTEGVSSEHALPPDHETWRDTLSAMDALRARLRARRDRRGALALDLPKLELRLDAEGRVTSLERSSRDRSHEIIEEFMLAANEAVARYCLRRRLPFLRRVHPEPDEEKVASFRELVEALGFEWRGSADASDFQRLVDDVSTSPLSPVVQLSMLRALGHARYEAWDGIHFALATDHYCHFTSPIRRYPDLLVHQVLALHLGGRLRGGGAIREWEERLERLGPRTSEQEKRAEQAERAMNQLRLLRHLEPRVGEEMNGFITVVHPFGFFVRIESILLEGLVHVATLADEYFEYDEEDHVLVGRRSGTTFRAGDRVDVVLAELDVIAREVRFRWISSPAETDAKTPKQRRSRSR